MYNVDHGTFLFLELLLLNVINDSSWNQFVDCSWNEVVDSNINISSFSDNLLFVDNFVNKLSDGSWNVSDSSSSDLVNDNLWLSSMLSLDDGIVDSSWSIGELSLGDMFVLSLDNIVIDCSCLIFDSCLLELIHRSNWSCEALSLSQRFG